MTRWHKLHGLGNDFLIGPIGSLDLGDEQRSARVSALCDRHRGLGADGILLWRREADGQVRMIIYNQDGSRPQMCGNGVRCLVAWLHREGHMGSDQITILSDAGPRHCRVLKAPVGQEDYLIEVDMGPPSLIPIKPAMTFDGEPIEAIGVSMGNPHAVIFFEELPSIERIDQEGARYNGQPSTRHPSFMEGVNVECCVRLEANTFEVIVYERGVGRTQACGTGACAVAYAAWLGELVAWDEVVCVRLPGGPLMLRFDGQTLWMSGPATYVYEAHSTL